MNIIIVGSGPSLSEVPPDEILKASQEGSFVVAVNGALDY